MKAHEKQSQKRPNYIVIVFDDTGWSDFGCFGSEISTPNIDGLAREGVRYTDFHVSPLCSPTRASLLTGRNAHRVGMGWLANRDLGTPGRRGRVDSRAAMLPAVLKSQGYSTYLSGKWHLAPRAECVPGGPYDQWPLSRGFDRFYGFLLGATDQYTPDITIGNEFVSPERPDDYHLSSDLVDQAIGFIADHESFSAGERPFFLQLSLSATHTPHQVAQEYIDKYESVFRPGWDAIRQARLGRQVSLGLLPPDTNLSERDPEVPAWEDLSDDEQRLAVRLQAAFAGFLEFTDEQIGRLLDFLQRSGLTDDTTIIVLSDNGAAGSGKRLGAVNPYVGPVALSEELSNLEMVGSRSGPGSYATGWGLVGNSPFRRYKEYVDEGGIRSPMIVKSPGNVPDPGGIRSQYAHVIDVMPTLLESAGAEAPATFEGIPQLPMDGVSFWPTLGDSDARAEERTQYFEVDALRAIRVGNYKAVADHVQGTPVSEDVWRLYDLSSDPTETRDIAGEHPGLLNDLLEAWEREALANSVLPTDDDRRMDELQNLRESADENKRRMVLRPEQAPFSRVATGIGTLFRDFTLTATFVGNDRDGVILASGADYGGWCLYVMDDILCFEHEKAGERTVITADRPIGAAGTIALLVQGAPDPRRSVELFVGSERVGAGEIARSGSTGSSRTRVEVGRDTPPTISARYADRGAFAQAPGAMSDVVWEFIDDVNTLSRTLKAW